MWCPTWILLVPNPILSICNDLPTITNFRIRLVADNTILIMTSNDLKKLEKTANDEINKIEKWLLLNQLTFNHSKLIICFFLLKKIVGRIFFYLCMDKTFTKLLKQNIQVFIWMRS